MRWVALVAFVLTACRGSVPPIELANERVQESVVRGFDASNDSGPAPLTVRHNPAPCDCPPYEVFAYGRWIRAFVEVDEALIAGLRSADKLAVATVTGRVSRPRAAGNGVMYPVVNGD